MMIIRKKKEQLCRDSRRGSNSFKKETFLRERSKDLCVVNDGDEDDSDGERHEVNLKGFSDSPLAADLITSIDGSK